MHKFDFNHNGVAGPGNSRVTYHAGQSVHPESGENGAVVDGTKVVVDDREVYV